MLIQLMTGADDVGAYSSHRRAALSAESSPVSTHSAENSPLFWVYSKNCW